ncbi:FMN reductase, partial [Burkholderia multivorans]
MRIALFGASGMVGSRVTKEAADRGHEVTAITRSGTEVPGAARSITGEMGDAAFDAQIVADHDVIVSTTGPSRTGGDHGEWLDALRTIAAASGDTRIFVVGGAGSPLADGVMLKDTPRFPEPHNAEAE